MRAQIYVSCKFLSLWMDADSGLPKVEDVKNWLVKAAGQ
jgi:hypothetical protein